MNKLESNILKKYEYYDQILNKVEEWHRLYVNDKETGYISIELVYIMSDIAICINYMVSSDGGVIYYRDIRGVFYPISSKEYDDILSIFTIINRDSNLNSLLN